MSQLIRIVYVVVALCLAGGVAATDARGGDAFHVAMTDQASQSAGDMSPDATAVAVTEPIGQAAAADGVGLSRSVDQDADPSFICTLRHYGHEVAVHFSPTRTHDRVQLSVREPSSPLPAATGDNELTTWQPWVRLDTPRTFDLVSG